MSNGRILKSWFTQPDSVQPRVIDSNEMLEKKMLEHEKKSMHLKNIKDRTHIRFNQDEQFAGDEQFVEGLFAERITPYEDEDGRLVYNGEDDPAEALTKELLAEGQANSKDHSETHVERNTNPIAQSERELFEQEKAEFQEQQDAYQEALEQLEERFRELLRKENEADSKCQEMIRNAKNEAEQIRKQAMEEGKQAGIELGRKEGLEQAQSEIDQTREELDARKQELEKYYDTAIRELEPKFIETLTGIYHHIFRVDFSERREIIQYLIENALKRAEGGRNFIVHVSKEEYTYVSQQKKRFMAIVSSDTNVDVIEDMTLHLNECFIETDGGIFDCSVGTELTELEKELKLLSYRSGQKK